MTRIYLAGPMTGLPQYNYPAFHAESARLRSMGYTVENPAENQAPACGTWNGWLKVALRQMLTCDVVATLPGWQKSKGAMFEVATAQAVGINVLPAADIVRECA